MAHFSPAVTLVWALLSIMLQTFLLYHLWSFDRFKCLKWNHGPHSGAFKRIMTYSYLSSVPLIMIYSVGFAAIKYTYGYAVVPGSGIMPTPYELWSKTAQNAIFPLYLSFSVAWGLEIMTHLEELCFWLFFVNAGSTHQDWFHTRYFKIWVVGSCIAVLAMPLITIFTREDVYKCEAYTFLIGGLGSLALTISFLPVLWVFPSFVGNLKQHDVEMGTLVRLTRFHEMNCIRVLFRFLFTIPVVILGVDGVRSHQHINDKMFPTDFLAIIAGIGCFISSGITLVIFFPRWIEGEIAEKERRGAAGMQRRQESLPRWNAPPESDVQSYISITHSKSEDMLDRYDLQAFGIGAPQYQPTPPGTCPNGGLPAYEVVVTRAPERIPSTKVALEGVGCHHLAAHSLTPNRLMVGGEVELGAVLTGSEVELARTRFRRNESVSSLVRHWRSPIEIGRPTVSRWKQQI